MNDHTRYTSALHAVQSGVKMCIERGVSDTQEGDWSPKHLRVGVNAAMCDSAALAKLLIAKGVITESEYLKAIADEMEAEKERYERRLSATLGIKITLG